MNDPKLLNAAQTIASSASTSTSLSNIFPKSSPLSPTCFNLKNTNTNTSQPSPPNCTSGISIKLAKNINNNLISKSVDYQQPAPPAQAQPQQPLHLFQQHQNHHQMPIQSSFYNQFSSSLQRSASSQTTQQQQQQHQHQQQHYAESHHQQQYQQSHSAHNSRPVSVQQSMQFENYHTPQVLSPSATPIPRTTSAASTTSSFRHQQDSMAHIPLPAAAHHVLTPIPAVRPSSVATSIAGTIVHTTTLPKPPPGPRNPMFSAAGSAVLNVANPSLLPNCATCATVIRGPFISAIGKIWCPHHFVCAHPSCGINLENVGFVEENGKLYCEKDFEQFLAPNCFKCKGKILNECCNALEKHFHPECFVCTACKQKIGTGNFHMEDGVPYCEKDYTKLFATKCAGCDFPIEAGDKFFEALSQNWHVECFTCTHCHVPLHTTGFATKLNKPYCKKHAY